MSYSLAFWVCMLVWLVFGFFAAWPISDANKGRLVAGNLLLFILMVLLGLQVFGKALHP